MLALVERGEEPEVDEERATRGAYLLRLNTEDPERPTEFELLGRTWDLVEGVFSPSYTVFTELLTRWIPYPVGGRFLEMGAGTGVTAVVAALSGCAAVTALDISAAAVENVRRNAERHGVADVVTVARSDLFAALAVDERFDVVYWNSNYIEMEPDFVNESDVHHALYDPGFETHRRFLVDVPDRLVPGGRVLLGFSDLGSWGSLTALCAELGLGIEVLRSERRVQSQPVEFQLLEVTGPAS